jgi:hypothetical protein
MTTHFFLIESKKKMQLSLLAILCMTCVLSIKGSLIHPQVRALDRQNNRNPVRFGSLNVEVVEDDLHHHKRQLGSLIHETVQSRLIYLPQQWPHLEEGEVIEFELFDGMVVLGRTEALTYRSEDSVGWNGDIRISTGNLEEDLKTSDGYFGLSCFEKACVANIKIYSTDQEFNIAPSGIPLDDSGNGVYAVSEIALDPSKRTGVTHAHVIRPINQSTTPKVHNHLRGFEGSENNYNLPSVTTLVTDTDNIVDILVLYTPQAVSTYGGGR